MQKVVFEVYGEPSKITALSENLKTMEGVVLQQDVGSVSGEEIRAGEVWEEVKGVYILKKCPPGFRLENTTIELQECQVLSFCLHIFFAAFYVAEMLHTSYRSARPRLTSLRVHEPVLIAQVWCVNTLKACDPKMILRAHSPSVLCRLDAVGALCPGALFRRALPESVWRIEGDSQGVLTYRVVECPRGYALER